MSDANYWALIITINTIITSIAIGNILLTQESQPPKWASWPTEYLRNQIQRIINRVKDQERP